MLIIFYKTIHRWIDEYIGKISFRLSDQIWKCFKISKGWNVGNEGDIYQSGKVSKYGTDKLCKQISTIE